MATVVFKTGTRAKYDALETKDSGTLYWLTDTQELFKGETLYGIGADATENYHGLMSAVDKKFLDDLSDTGVLGLSAADTSVSLSKINSEMKVGVLVNADDDNKITLTATGLKVVESEYSIEKQETAESGYAASYYLTKDGTKVGDTLNVPKDFLVRSASLETVAAADTPYSGAAVGDKYIDFVINTVDSSETAQHIYLAVNDLVDTYTGGDGIDITNNEISIVIDASAANGLVATATGLGLSLATSSTAGALSATDKAYIDTLPTVLANKTTQSLTGTNGKALVFNESDGGGVKFEHNDGTWSFVGVNEGGKDGITGQLYSVMPTNGVYIGSRINMTTEAFYYLGNKSSSAYTADDEIATLGDIADAVAGITAGTLVWEEM